MTIGRDRMAQEINLGGTIYVSSKRGAEITGYAQDYVSQLARSGQLQARRVAGMWYIHEGALRQYKDLRDNPVIEDIEDIQGAQSAPVPTPEPIPAPSPVPEASELPVVAEEHDLDASINLDGKDYISATRASKITGYSHDYVSQLARTEKVPSHQIGNRWYVDRSALIEHKKEKDALLAAVQTQSVGLLKPDAAPAHESELLDEAEEPESHFTYQQEDRELLPRLDEKEPEVREEYEPRETSAEAEDEINQIQIRVVPEKNPIAKERVRSFEEIDVPVRAARSSAAPKIVMWSVVCIGIVMFGTAAFMYVRSSSAAIPIPGRIEASGATASSAERISSKFAPLAEFFFSKTVEYRRAQ